MSQRYSFITILLSLIAATGWWSDRVDKPIEELRSQPLQHSVEIHRGLVESLDRLVVYERYYRSVHGRFTKLISRVGFTIPSAISNSYEIHVTDAGAEKLLITAFSEVDGKISDLASIDQDYAVHADFSLPLPRPEYLKFLAAKHLRNLKSAPKGQIIEEEGVYRGFFSYENNPGSDGERSIFAVGIKPPVLGVQIALNESDVAMGSTEDWMDVDLGASDSSKTGQTNLGEDTYLAQEIFRGETGRYAKNLSELSQVAHFQYAPESPTDSNDRAPASGDAVLQSPTVLEIEPILPIESKSPMLDHEKGRR